MSYSSEYDNEFSKVINLLSEISRGQDTELSYLGDFAKAMVSMLAEQKETNKLLTKLVEMETKQAEKEDKIIGLLSEQNDLLKKLGTSKAKSTPSQPTSQKSSEVATLHKDLRELVVGQNYSNTLLREISEGQRQEISRLSIIMGEEKTQRELLAKQQGIMMGVLNEDRKINSFLSSQGEFFVREATEAQSYLKTTMIYLQSLEDSFRQITGEPVRELVFVDDTEQKGIDALNKFEQAKAKVNGWYGGNSAGKAGTGASTGQLSKSGSTEQSQQQSR